jgi:hypothetical protein
MISLACVIVYANSFLGCLEICDDATLLTYSMIGSWTYNLQSLSSFLYSLAYHVSGYNPWSWHLISLILHILTSILAFNFLRLFFDNKVSLIGAIIFAVHPVHTEAVTWISGRVYILNAFFTFSIVLLFIESIKAKFKLLPYLLSLVLYVFWAREANPFFMSVPAVLLIVGSFFGLFKKTIKGVISFLAVTLVGLMTLLPKIPAHFIERNENGVNMLQELANTNLNSWLSSWTFSAIASIKLLFNPVGLTYYHEPNFCYTYFTVQIFLAYIISALILSLLFPTLKSIKIVLMSTLLFLVLMFPIFSPIRVVSLVAERYLYLPSIIASLLLCLILETFKNSKTIFISSVAFILFFSTLTILRNNDYRSALVYWTKTVEVSPYSYRAHNNLALEYFKINDYDSAIYELKESLRCKPYHKNAINNIQAIELCRGRRVKEIKVNQHNFLYIFAKTNFRDGVFDKHLYKKL